MLYNYLFQCYNPSVFNKSGMASWIDDEEKVYVEIVELPRRG